MGKWWFWRVAVCLAKFDTSVMRANWVKPLGLATWVTQKIALGATAGHAGSTATPGDLSRNLCWSGNKEDLPRPAERTARRETMGTTAGHAGSTVGPIGLTCHERKCGEGQGGGDDRIAAGRTGSTANCLFRCPATMVT